MTVAERIRNIRILEMMEQSENCEKLKDGTIVYKDDFGNVLMTGKNNFKREES